MYLLSMLKYLPKPMLPLWNLGRFTAGKVTCRDITPWYATQTYLGRCCLHVGVGRYLGTFGGIAYLL